MIYITRFISVYIPKHWGWIPCVISNHLYNCSRFSCFWAWFFNEQSRWENAQPPTNIRTAEVEPQAIWAMLVPSSSNNFGKIRENPWIIGTWWEIKWKIMGKTANPLSYHHLSPKERLLGWFKVGKSDKLAPTGSNNIQSWNSRDPIHACTTFQTTNFKNGL